MTLLFVSFIAGVLTVLAPCILPLLPVVIGTSVGSARKSTPYIVIGSLALSILLFTYLLKASTLLIDIPPAVWGYFSGGILVGFGLVFIFPKLWERLPFVARTNAHANQLLGTGYQKKSVWGDVMIGAALGPVFSSCSPTYFVILATVLPASFWLGTVYLLAYIAGLVVVLVVIALLGQKLIVRLLPVATDTHWLKPAIGILFVVVGVFIITGYDKKIETWVLERGLIDGALDFEQRLLEPAQDSPNSQASATNHSTPTITVPAALARDFPHTDFSRADTSLQLALSGGPVKDGIPAIDNPTFVPLSEFSRPDDVQAIVIIGAEEVKVYPYNILIMHEIVNDVVDDTPLAITFCPLCGSAIVFNRTLPDGQVSTFGVSGSLLESNMIMFDRTTENLWQQSTGQTLAGSFHPSTLALEPFQLMTMGDIKTTFPQAIVLSEDTGHRRDYGRNLYAGYDTDDRFLFPPSDLDTTFEPKTIMVVFRDGATTFTVPWLALRAAGKASYTGETNSYTLTVTDGGELTITDTKGTNYPFYFEMWFSVAVQHDESELIVINPT